MRRLGIVVKTIGALAVFSAAISASAWAVALPEFSVKTNASGTMGSGIIETTSQLLGPITFTKGTTEFTPTSKDEGTVHNMFEGVKCKDPFGTTAAGESLGDTKEVALALGTYRIVRRKPGFVEMQLFLSPIHLECLFAFGTLLLLVEGDLLGELTPVLTKTTKYEVELTQAKGKQGLTEYENDLGEKVKAGGLKTSIDEATAVTAGLEVKEAKFTTSSETTLEKTS